METTKEILTRALRSTKRENIDSLIDFMEESGFFEAPASGGNHECKKGGLAQHTLDVYTSALSIANALLSEDKYIEWLPSITIASILHDLGKVGDYGKPMYVTNMIKDGRPTKANPQQKYKQSESKPFKRNTDLLGVPHALRSVKLATLYIDLTEDEEFAIFCHDGLYDFARPIIMGHETMLYLIVHYADLWATKIIEKEGGANDGVDENNAV